MPPWAPYPGASSGPLNTKSSPVSPTVAPTTAPNEPSGSAPALSPRRWSRIVPVTERPSSVRAACTSGASLLEVRASTNRPASCLRAASTKRVERAEAEERADGDRVGGERARGVEVGLGVRLAGRADVAALHVEQDERAGLPGGRDDPLEHGHAPAAEPLVERRLRLHHRALGGQRLGGAEREPFQARDRVVEPPLVQQRGVRVDAGAERAARAHRRVDAGPKVYRRSCGPLVGVVTPLSPGKRRAVAQGAPLDRASTRHRARRRDAPTANASGMPLLCATIPNRMGPAPRPDVDGRRSWWRWPPRARPPARVVKTAVKNAGVVKVTPRASTAVPASRPGGRRPQRQAGPARRRSRPAHRRPTAAAAPGRALSRT